MPQPRGHREPDRPPPSCSRGLATLFALPLGNALFYSGGDLCWSQKHIYIYVHIRTGNPHCLLEKKRANHSLRLSRLDHALGHKRLSLAEGHERKLRSPQDLIDFTQGSCGNSWDFMSHCRRFPIKIQSLMGKVSFSVSAHGP